MWIWGGNEVTWRQTPRLRVRLTPWRDGVASDANLARVVLLAASCLRRCSPMMHIRTRCQPCSSTVAAVGGRRAGSSSSSSSRGCVGDIRTRGDSMLLQGSRDRRQPHCHRLLHLFAGGIAVTQPCASTHQVPIVVLIHGTPDRQTRCVSDVGRLPRPVHCCQKSLIDTRTGRRVSQTHSNSGPRSTVRTTAADCSSCALLSPPLSGLYSTATRSK